MLSDIFWNFFSRKPDTKRKLNFAFKHVAWNHESILYADECLVNVKIILFLDHVIFRWDSVKSYTKSWILELSGTIRGMEIFK